MNKVYFFLFACLVFFTACQEQKRPAAGPEPILRPPSMDYSHQDSLEIKNLVDTYIGYFAQKDMESVCDMLYFVRNDSILPLTEQRREGFSRAMSQLPVYACKMDGLILRSDKNNNVQISVQITRDGDLDKGIGVMKMNLNPVLKDGHWYLTVFDEHAEGVRNFYK